MGRGIRFYLRKPCSSIAHADSRWQEHQTTGSSRFPSSLFFPIGSLPLQAHGDYEGSLYAYRQSGGL